MIVQRGTVALVSRKSFCSMFFIATSIRRRIKRPYHKGKSRRDRLRKPKQPTPRSRFVCLFGSFLCIDGTTMMQ